MAPHSLYYGPFLAVLSLAQAPTAKALANFRPNCTLPDPDERLEASFVRNPNVRGSLQIVWTCLLTLLVCVYQVIHLNIPQRKAPQQGPIAKWTDSFISEAKQIWRSLKWAIPIIIAPELILTESIFELKDAQQKLEELHEDHPGARAWTLTHMLYANMGGLVVVHQGIEYHLQGEDISEAISEHYLTEQPPVTETQIKDKSKDDNFTKGIAVMQILYFYIEFITRWGLGQPSSLFELAVASTGVYSLVSYCCLWHKPKGVMTPTVIPIVWQRPPRPDVGSRMSSVLSKLQQRNDPTNGGIPAGPPRRSRSKPINRTDSLKTKILHNPKVASFGRMFRHGEDIMKCWLAFLLTSIPLGVIHLCGWNFDFPSIVDRWLWRSSSLVATTAGPVIVMLAVVLFAIDDLITHGLDDNDWLYMIGVVFAALLAFLYVVARLILIVEMIRCLFFLPAGAYVATSWVMSIPHAG